MNSNETLNTLRFASRTKKIKNKAIVNEDAKDALLRRYKKQIDELKYQLQLQESEQGIGGETHDRDHSVHIEQRFKVDDKSLSDIGLTKNQNCTLTKQQNEVVAQLTALKAKIMVGGENLLEKAELHERLLRESESELKHQRRKEKDLEEAYRKRQQEISKIEESFGTLQDQVKQSDLKLKRAISMYKATKSELDDVKSEHNQLKDDLLAAIRTTNREIKLANCVIENYFPNKFLELINSHATYDPCSEEWQIRFIAFAGNNTKVFSEQIQLSQKKTQSVESKAGTERNLANDIYLRHEDM